MPFVAQSATATLVTTIRFVGLVCNVTLHDYTLYMPFVAQSVTANPESTGFYHNILLHVWLVP
jgi:hypothetical protein